MVQGIFYLPQLDWIQSFVRVARQEFPAETDFVFRLGKSWFGRVVGHVSRAVFAGADQLDAGDKHSFCGLVHLRRLSVFVPIEREGFGGQTNLGASRADPVGRTFV